jgi:hypothetical protein
MQQPNPTNLNSVELQQLTTHNTNVNAQTNQVDIQTDDNNLNQAKSSGLQSNKRADRQGRNELTDDESDEEDPGMDAEYNLAIAQLARSIEWHEARGNRRRGFNEQALEIGKRNTHAKHRF